MGLDGVMARVKRAGRPAQLILAISRSPQCISRQNTYVRTRGGGDGTVSVRRGHHRRIQAKHGHTGHKELLGGLDHVQLGLERGHEGGGRAEREGGGEGTERALHVNEETLVRRSVFGRLVTGRDTILMRPAFE